jgi:small-conductance mechanosensitive channel/CRP-like cAMP-binding protein
LTFATPLLIAAALLLFLAAALQAVATNRYVKKKLQFSIFLTALSLGIGLVQLHPDLAKSLQDFKRVPDLLFVLAFINTGVIIALNPLRVDRISDRFPNIVQDSLIVGMFFIVATVVFKETILTASAVSAVVVGFALQDTLGNAFAGLGIQIEKPFRVGNWIKVGDFEGKVSQVTWRATKLLTRAGTYIVVPNNIISKESITNYSEPILPVRIFVEVGATYNKPPNVVKAAMLEAVAQAPLALSSPAPDVLLMDFAGSAITYRARFWIEDFEVDDVARDQVRTSIYYSFARRGIEIPYPIQIEMSREETANAILKPDDMVSLLGAVQIFAALSEDERKQLASRCREAIYATGEMVVRQGEAGTSMFIVYSGQVRVTIEPGNREVARTDPGGFFGEMSLLTGDPRTATVSATCDSVLLEIPADGFRQIALAQPAVVEAVGVAVVARRAGLDQARAEAALLDASLREQSRSLISRVRRFLRLPAA